MAGFRVEGNTSGNVAEVDAGHHLLTNLGKDTALAGYVAIMSENDDGTDTGVPYLQSPETSDDFRLRVGMDTLLLSESFNYTAQNSGVFKHVLTTMTITYAAGLVNLNAGASVATNTQALFQTWRTFPLTGAAPSYFEWTALYMTTLQTDNVMEIGAGIPSTATPWALNDGIVFRYTAAGELKGVIANNGSETMTPAFTNVPAVGVLHKYVITVNQTEVEFWIDDTLQAKLDIPGGTGSPCSESALPAFVRTYNAAAFAGTAQLVKIANMNCSLGDWATNKAWSDQAAGAGLSAIQGAGGMAQGSTANYANSAAPASATLANATAGYTTLGGQWQFVAVAGAETDYALFGYLVPAPAIAVTGRQLFITGVSISAINTVAAVATTATVLQWSIAVGSSAVSLAQAEGAATKARRVKTLGFQSFPIGAAIAAAPTPPEIFRNFDTPLVANAGEYVHVILKMPIATATATQIIRGTCSITGYWE